MRVGRSLSVISTYSLSLALSLSSEIRFIADLSNSSLSPLVLSSVIMFPVFEGTWNEYIYVYVIFITADIFHLHEVLQRWLIVFERKFSCFCSENCFFLSSSSSLGFGLSWFWKLHSVCVYLFILHFCFSGCVNASDRILCGSGSSISFYFFGLLLFTSIWDLYELHGFDSIFSLMGHNQNGCIFVLFCVSIYGIGFYAPLQLKSFVVRYQHLNSPFVLVFLLFRNFIKSPFVTINGLNFFVSHFQKYCINYFKNCFLTICYLCITFSFSRG